MVKVLSLFLLVAAVSFVGCGGGNYSFEAKISREHLLFLHNVERGRRQLPQLEHDADLTARAQRYAEWMASNRRLVHSKLGGTKFMAEGENIALGQPNEEEVMKDWMESPGHRKNILDRRFTHAGLGFAKRPDGAVYWCVQFGGK